MRTTADRVLSLLVGREGGSRRSSGSKKATLKGSQKGTTADTLTFKNKL